MFQFKWRLQKWHDLPIKVQFLLVRGGGRWISHMTWISYDYFPLPANKNCFPLQPWRFTGEHLTNIPSFLRWSLGRLTLWFDLSSQIYILNHCTQIAKTMTTSTNTQKKPETDPKKCSSFRFVLFLFLRSTHSFSAPWTYGYGSVVAEFFFSVPGSTFRSFTLLAHSFGFVNGFSRVSRF